MIFSCQKGESDIFLVKLGEVYIFLSGSLYYLLTSDSWYYYVNNWDLIFFANKVELMFN